ncbi:prolyl oligopeptidase family serine peptidase [Shewanella maritima]|uniref:S9 family peptidase n=1 Tax=Shewanella maritima TaxID=2520507 RepID=UPI0037361C28
MKKLMRHFAISALSLAVITGCNSTPSSTISTAVKQDNAIQVPLAQPPQAETALTLNQIMANPDWMGIFAKGQYWADDSKSIYYARQAHQAPITDYYQLSLNDGAKAQKLAINQLHQADQRFGSFNADHSKKAYLYQGNVFVKTLATGDVQQLTKLNGKISDIRFLSNGDIAYFLKDNIYRIHADTGMVEQIADIRMSKAPKGVNEPESYLAKQQHRLINYVSMQHENAKAKQAFKDEVAATDPSFASKTWYLGDSESITKMSLSADGRYVFMALIDKSYSWRSEHDIMPDYLGKDGYVDAVPARARVAEDDFPGHRFVLLDLQEHQQKDITIEGLDGFDEDVLAKVKAENAKAKGETYRSESEVRKIQLMQDWGWSQSAIQWHPTENSLLVMLEAVDNKDRWIASVDLKKGSLTTEHRLHDTAWVNYTFNQYGWLGNSSNFYYLSEQSGYSQLYVKNANGKVTPLTDGKYVVDQVTASRDGKHLYYRANPSHPGIYNVFRVSTDTAEIEQLTDWKGTLDYTVSPDEQHLLLSASSRIKPAELYVQPIGGKLTQLTNYTSKAFKQYPWQAPQVVAVPSNHGAGDVYARVYLPQGYDADSADKYPAVIFNHGAGYLQNAHYGFSGYFREFMFHNMLAQQGYVVMDMDFRGSKGYGRDWRTAIYRNMGYPEVEDLKDGVTWMASNANVDTKRVGTYGGSYGGFLTFMALFNEPELFQAGAALRPVTDWAHYNAPYTSNILNKPDVDPIAYERSSPIEHAEGLQKPLLIMSGVLDDNVFFQDSVRLVQRLIELEKPMFETAIYPVEPHGFKQPSSWLDEYRRIYKLFEQELK